MKFFLPALALAATLSAADTPRLPVWREKMSPLIPPGYVVRHTATPPTLDGRLDAVLSLPVHPLGHLLMRRIEPTNLGDVVFGVTLFVVAGHPTPGRTVVFVGVSMASVVLLTSFLVLTGSLSFFAGRSDGGELGFNAIMLLGNYPLDLFGGAARVMLYTVIPAAFVATVPAQLIIRFDVRRAAILGGVSATFAVAALRVFNAGLRRYASGSVWTRA